MHVSYYFGGAVPQLSNTPPCAIYNPVLAVPVATHLGSKPTSKKKAKRERFCFWVGENTFGVGSATGNTAD